MHSWSSFGIGDWEVLEGGRSVFQHINSGGLALFASEQEYQNVIIRGTLEVQTPDDDDWIGFGLGIQYPTRDRPYWYDLTLLDWRKSTSGGVSGIIAVPHPQNTPDHTQTPQIGKGFTLGSYNIKCAHCQECGNMRGWDAWGVPCDPPESKWCFLHEDPEVSGPHGKDCGPTPMGFHPGHPVPKSEWWMYPLQEYIWRHQEIGFPDNPHVHYFGGAYSDYYDTDGVAALSHAFASVSGASFGELKNPPDVAFGPGWVEYEQYEFTILYTENRLKLVINNEVILDMDAENTAGSMPSDPKFGKRKKDALKIPAPTKTGRIAFYNHSQGKVKYGNVVIAQVDPDQNPAPHAEGDTWGVPMDHLQNSSAVPFCDHIDTLQLQLDYLDGILANDYDPNILPMSIWVQDQGSLEFKPVKSGQSVLVKTFQGGYIEVDSLGAVAYTPSEWYQTQAALVIDGSVSDIDNTSYYLSNPDNGTGELVNITLVLRPVAPDHIAYEAAWTRSEIPSIGDMMGIVRTWNDVENVAICDMEYQCLDCLDGAFEVHVELCMIAGR
eukprot:gene2955-579_t